VSIDVSHLAPQDAVVALRSYPRRYGSQLAPLKDDDNQEAMAARPGPDGVSAIDIVVDTARALERVRQALERVRVEDDPELPAEVGDLDRPEAGGAGVDIEGARAQLTAAAESLAAVADRVPAKEWGRSGRITGTRRKVAALDLLRDAVRLGSDNLHRVEETLRAVRAT
jgi:hypothetical protein